MTTAGDAFGRPRAGRPAGDGQAAGDIVACRDDGPLARQIGRVVQGQLPPLLPAVAGVTVTAVLAALGLRNLPGVLLLTPAVAMLLAALGADHPHDGRGDWLVPALLQAGQYVYLAALAFALGVPAPATFALIAVIALHHMDLLHRHRYGVSPGPRVAAAGPGLGGADAGGRGRRDAGHRDVLLHRAGGLPGPAFRLGQPDQLAGGRGTASPPG